MASQHPPRDYHPFRSIADKPVLPVAVMPARIGVMAQGRLTLAILARLIDLVQEWRERYRQRRHLASLDHHMLRDIGLSSADVEQEIRKPFWRL